MEENGQTEKSRRIANVMIMPLYVSSLEPCPQIGVETGQKLYSQIACALHTIHSCEFQHMDVKPANICMRDNGDFVLIDLGSVISIESYSLSTTVYLPRDYQPGRRVPYRYQATEIHDWVMLGSVQYYQLGLPSPLLLSMNSFLFLELIMPLRN